MTATAKIKAKNVSTIRLRIHALSQNTATAHPFRFGNNVRGMLILWIVPAERVRRRKELIPSEDTCSKFDFTIQFLEFK